MSFEASLLVSRSPIRNVMTYGPTGKMLTDEFLQLTFLILNALNKPGTCRSPRTSIPSHLRDAGVVASILKFSGLSCFLLPSLFSNLQRAASVGPVTIVNTSKYSFQCDALVCRSHRNVSTEPRDLTVRATMADMTRKLASLRKL